MMPQADAPITRRVPWRGVPDQPVDLLLSREWLVTNGLGGFSNGTVCGVPTRAYHGLLVAALPAPLGRVLLLGPLSEQIRVGDHMLRLGGEEYQGGRLDIHSSSDQLLEFALEDGLPVWKYEVGGAVLEKRIWMPHRQNTVMVAYRLLEAREPVRLKLRPALHARGYDTPVNTPLPKPFRLHAYDDRLEIATPGEFPSLRLYLHGGGGKAFTIEGKVIPEVLHRVEASRGYASSGELYTPGYYRADLAPGQRVVLVASCEDWALLDALKPDEAEAAEARRRKNLISQAPPEAREGVGAELVLAADQFLFTPVGRAEEAARIRATGDESRSVIAGYHWFTDWGRDTMISLEGLTLRTGRQVEAGYILRTFAHHVRDGLIPNYFPDGKNEGVYHTADATLWFFQALNRYVEETRDEATLRRLLPMLSDIVSKHLEGTRFGIKVDPEDGLLAQGAPGYQLTWMDAKVGDWVVTPRRGKAVEINALWYNALCLLRQWLERDGGGGHHLDGHIARCRESFNERFWNEAARQLYDVVDGEAGDDPAFRPNQLFAISLPHAVLDEKQWKPVVEAARERLLTPVGLRSLAPGLPDYKPMYYGDLRSRDAAYHQGTVWSWLIGPFVDAWLRVYPEQRKQARKFLEGFIPHLDEACVGQVSEIFDAELPFTARGCVAQAWGVAELLRCWVRTA
ncbi:MAG: amylo-alpha-1,6-glucosidase [Gemmataceae bacterium]|nr:amylo-alpha-1,6-glucosidase [Gemmataceae bacterium]